MKKCIKTLLLARTSMILKKEIMSLFEQQHQQHNKDQLHLYHCSMSFD